MSGLPPFTLKKKFFPREIGGIILRHVVGKLDTAIEQLSFLFCRLVCKTWYALLPISMRKGVDMHTMIPTMLKYNENDRFWPFLDTLIEWGYPIRVKRPNGSVFSAVANARDVPTLKSLMLIDSDVRIFPIVSNAIDNKYPDIIKYLAPTYILDRKLQASIFEYALWSKRRSIRMLKLILSLIPKQQKISIGRGVTTPVTENDPDWKVFIAFLFDSFDREILLDWQLRLDARKYAKLIEMVDTKRTKKRVKYT